jgi:hypothetical protein
MLVTVADDTVRAGDLTDPDHPRSAAAPLMVPDHHLHTFVRDGDAEVGQPRRRWSGPVTEFSAPTGAGTRG